MTPEPERIEDYPSNPPVPPSDDQEILKRTSEFYQEIGANFDGQEDEQQQADTPDRDGLSCIIPGKRREARVPKRYRDEDNWTRHQDINTSSSSASRTELLTKRNRGRTTAAAAKIPPSEPILPEIPADHKRGDHNPNKSRKAESWLKPRGNYEWESMEVKEAPETHGGGRGVFMRTGVGERGGKPPCKGEYGGKQKTKAEYDALIASGNLDDCRYLLAIRDPEGNITYTDGHPKHLVAEGKDPSLWIGALCNQANTAQECNAIYVRVNNAEQYKRPPRDGIDRSIRAAIKLTREVGPGEQVLVNYGYSIQTQMDYKLGYTYYHRCVLGKEGLPEWDSESHWDEKGETAVEMDELNNTRACGPPKPRTRKAKASQDSTPVIDLAGNSSGDQSQQVLRNQDCGTQHLT